MSKENNSNSGKFGDYARNAAIVLGLFSFATLFAAGLVDAEKSGTIDDVNLKSKIYREEIADELESTWGIKNFNLSNISLNSLGNEDYVKLFGTKDKQFTNIYVSVDENSSQKIFDLLEKNIELLKKSSYNINYTKVNENRNSIVKEIIKIINSATEEDYYVENIGDVQVIKNYFNEIITGEKRAMSINNNVYGDENSDFSIGNVLISDIRKNDDGFVIDFVGLDEDLLFSSGVTTAGLGLSTSGLGLFVGTSNGTKVEEIKQLNNYSLTITTKGSLLEDKLKSLIDGDKHYELKNNGEFDLLPQIIDKNYISYSYNKYSQLDK